MKTLTDIVCALVGMMKPEEQAAYLKTMAQGTPPSRPQRAKTEGEKWWYGKLNDEEAWITTWTSDDLLDDFIEGTACKKTRHGAATSMGMMLGKVCPDTRRNDGDWIMPDLKEARRAWTDVFPSGRPVASVPGGPEGAAGQTLLVDGKMYNVLKTTHD